MSSAEMNRLVVELKSLRDQLSHETESLKRKLIHQQAFHIIFKIVVDPAIPVKVWVLSPVQVIAVAFEVNGVEGELKVTVWVSFVSTSLNTTVPFAVAESVVSGVPLISGMTIRRS